MKCWDASEEEASLSEKPRERVYLVSQKGTKVDEPWQPLKTVGNFCWALVYWRVANIFISVEEWVPFSLTKAWVFVYSRLQH